MAKSDKNISEKIVDFMQRRDYRPQRTKRLARSMGVEEDRYPAFREAVRELMRAGRVVSGGGNLLMLSGTEAVDSVIGTFRGHERGFGFVVPDSPAEHGDLFIPPPATGGALTGDTVRARITRQNRHADELRVEGEVIEVLERGNSRFVGELRQEDYGWLVRPDGRSMHVPILVSDVRSTRAKSGDQVVVELTEYPSHGLPARGVIVEILGKHGDPEIDTISMIHEYHFRSEFAEEVIENARQVVKAHDYEAELPHRDDLRGETIVTIDPDEAKDFDDAISLTKTSEGRIELGVHIADVSQFVQKGSPLDEEASLRGNSIYFPRHVIPMLPEILSNGLCSLQEDQPRMAKSAFIRYDKNAKRVSARFANSVIQSTKRLTYQEATNIIEGKTGGFEPEVVDLVQRMETLARKIRKRRLADGMIVLDLPEVELEIDDEDRVTGVVPADTSFSHTIIEMFMVEANEVVAELFNNLNVPHIRRIHPDPPEDAQAGLSRLLRVLGKPVPETLEREDMIRLLASVKGQPESVAVNMAILRSMSQAEYSPKLIGHFALASRHYSHFTSPIRRYPDLVIHRLLQDYLDGKLDTKAGKEACPSSETLTDIGKRCSYTERRAEAAERELRQIKILRFLENHLGEIEEGVVTGVTNVGVFVQLRKYLIDGLVRFSDLPDDWWDVDAKAGCMVGQQSGTRVAIGDFVKVELAGVDVMSRELDLIIVEHRPSSRSTSAPNKRGERKSGANDRTSKRRRGGPKATKGGRRGDRRGREQSSSRKKVKRGKPKSSRRRR